MKKVFAVHIKITPAGEYDRFWVELFADDADAHVRAAELEAELSEEYTDESSVDIYILELPIN